MEKKRRRWLDLIVMFFIWGVLYSKGVTILTWQWWAFLALILVHDAVNEPTINA